MGVRRLPPIDAILGVVDHKSDLPLAGKVGGKHFLIFIHQTTTHCRQDCLCRDRALQRREFAV